MDTRDNAGIVADEDASKGNEEGLDGGEDRLNIDDGHSGEKTKRTERIPAQTFLRELTRVASSADMVERGVSTRDREQRWLLRREFRGSKGRERRIVWSFRSMRARSMAPSPYV